MFLRSHHHETKEPVYLWNVPNLIPDCALCFVLQAHHCRSMVPCQDSPSVKHTYYAQVTHTCWAACLQTVTSFSGVAVCLVSRCDLCFVSQVSVPKDLVAVMSAVRDGQEVDPQDNSRIVYRFRQPVSSLFFAYLLMICDVIFRSGSRHLLMNQ